MKKVLIILSIIMLLGCTEQHILHTYYGDINTKAIQGFLDTDSQIYYAINVEKVDKEICEAMGLDSACFVDFYKPSEDTYFRMLLGSDGGSSERIYYNPYKNNDSIR